MKKILPLILLFNIIVGLCLGQNKQFTIVKSKADSLRDLGKLDESLKEFSKIYQAKPTNRLNTYNYACALALLGHKDSAFHYLNIATANDSIVSALNDPDFYMLLEDERWSKLENEIIPRTEAKYKPYKNPELAKELWRMKIKDQAYYYHIKIARKQNGNKSPIIRALWELKSKINAANVARLTEIIESGGWPRSSEVGGMAANSAFLIVQHADINVQKKYLPLMRAAADAGEARWSALALLIDRVDLREGKKQTYGSQIYSNDDGSYYVKDLKDPEYVNQRRKKVGLSPIEQYVKRWDIEWKIEQKEK